MTNLADENHRVPADRLTAFVLGALTVAGAATDSAEAVTRALVSTSLRGVDSHGVRLLPHYLRALAGGRISRAPRIAVTRTAPGAAVVDADDGFGHPASYRAVVEGCRIAEETGVAAVSVVNSSHFGAAGCYALEAAALGKVAFAFCNSDAMVLLHDGVMPFHGTNPIAFAAPVAGERPFLVDMATSIVPGNRILDYKTKGLPLPEDVAVDAEGAMTIDAKAVAALMPIGGSSHGFKGASLAGIMEVLSAVLTGMAHGSRLLPMVGDDLATPRRLGHFFLVVDPEAFVPRAAYDSGMAAYLTDLRASPAKPGRRVMAPGDREWATEDYRRAIGIPLAPALLAEFEQIRVASGLEPTLLTALA